MTAAELVRTLTDRGVTLTPRDGDTLTVKPVSLVAPEELEELRARKPEVLRLLRPPEAGQGLYCFTCHGARFWRALVRYTDREEMGPWICTRCHPAPAEDMVAERTGEP